eukprot:scaffold6685_cov50-Phaeocystis_antarctica.AAC.1
MQLISTSSESKSSNLILTVPWPTLTTRPECMPVYARASVLCSSTWPLDWLLPDAGRLLGRPLLLARRSRDTSATSRALRCGRRHLSAANRALSRYRVLLTHQSAVALHVLFDAAAKRPVPHLEVACLWIPDGHLPRATLATGSAASSSVRQQRCDPPPPRVAASGELLLQPRLREQLLASGDGHRPKSLELSHRRAHLLLHVAWLPASVGVWGESQGLNPTRAFLRLSLRV